MKLPLANDAAVTLLLETLAALRVQQGNVVEHPASKALKVQRTLEILRRIQDDVPGCPSDRNADDR